jgi:hypothetical protein
MGFEVFDSKLAEILVSLALVTFCAGVVKQETSEPNFQPCWRVRVTVNLYDKLGDTRDYNTGVLLSC